MGKLHWRWSWGYFVSSLILFAIEVIIAVYFSNYFFIRAYLGDVLVVILLFSMIKTVVEVDDNLLLCGIFLFACLIEFSQHWSLAAKLGFRERSPMHIILGSYFSWWDIVCYATGCAILFLYCTIKKILVRTDDFNKSKINSSNNNRH